MNPDAFKKSPRLYVSQSLGRQETFELADEQAHYLRNVLRKGQGDTIRLFNGQDGEWLGVLRSVDKKAIIVACDSLIRAQPPKGPEIHLLFAPIKKNRLDFLIEKAVELGATHFHPVITRNTENRHLNETRLQAQLMEASEQCERLDMPRFLAAAPLEDVLQAWPPEHVILACLERSDAPPIMAALASGQSFAIMIGPEGGFTADEAQGFEKMPFIKPVTLGPAILRSETAVCSALAAIGHHRTR